MEVFIVFCPAPFQRKKIFYDSDKTKHKSNLAVIELIKAHKYFILPYYKYSNYKILTSLNKTIYNYKFKGK